MCNIWIWIQNIPHDGWIFSRQVQIPSHNVHEAVYPVEIALLRHPKNSKFIVFRLCFAYFNNLSINLDLSAKLFIYTSNFKSDNLQMSVLRRVEAMCVLCLDRFHTPQMALALEMSN